VAADLVTRMAEHNAAKPDRTGKGLASVS